jgi:antitoxin ParD1/3/4
MATIERITIALPTEMAESVRNAIACGDYASSSEVFRDALREWKLKRARHEKEMQALDLGIAKGLQDMQDGKLYPADAVFNTLEQKYRAMLDDEA